MSIFQFKAFLRVSCSETFSWVTSELFKILLLLWIGKLNINSLDASKNIGDMKVQNIKTGKQSHSSRFPCIYGDGCRKQLYSKKRITNPQKRKYKMKENG